jgi:hypothetical protein
MQQGVGLRLAQLQILEEVEQETHFVEREADDIDLKGDCDDDLQSKFAASQHTGDLAILVVRTAINAVGNQHGLALFQTPHRPRMGQPAIAGGDAVGIDFFGPFRLRNLVGGANTAASPFGFRLVSFLAAGLLPLLFGAHRKRFLDLGWARGAGQLLLQFRDPLLKFCVALLGGLQFTLQSPDQIDQPIGIDPPGAQVFLELLNHVHPRFLDTSVNRGKASFTE